MHCAPLRTIISFHFVGFGRVEWPYFAITTNTNITLFVFEDFIDFSTKSLNGFKIRIITQFQTSYAEIKFTSSLLK